MCHKIVPLELTHSISGSFPGSGREQRSAWSSERCVVARAVAGRIVAIEIDVPVDVARQDIGVEWCGEKEVRRRSRDIPVGYGHVGTTLDPVECVLQSLPVHAMPKIDSLISAHPPRPAPMAVRAEWRASVGRILECQSADVRATPLDGPRRGRYATKPSTTRFLCPRHPASRHRRLG